MVIVAAAAAILGDNAGYWIGREGGLRLAKRYGRVLHIDEGKMERARQFFDRHGAKSVFIGRFIALLRTWAAVLAGVGDMQYSNHADLYIVDISERLPRKLITNVPDDAVPSWSHNGKWIYFLGGAGLGWGKIYRCSPQGGPAIALSARPGYGPKDSLDGETVYFASNIAGKIVLKTVSAGLPGKESVVEGPPPVWFWDWTVVPGGIYFVSGYAPKSLVYFDFASKKVRQVFESDKGFSVGLSVSPDGRWLLYSQADGIDGDIMLVDQFR